MSSANLFWSISSCPYSFRGFDISIKHGKKSYDKLTLWECYTSGKMYRCLAPVEPGWPHISLVVMENAVFAVGRYSTAGHPRIPRVEAYSINFPLPHTPKPNSSVQLTQFFRSRRIMHSVMSYAPLNYRPVRLESTFSLAIFILPVSCSIVGFSIISAVVVEMVRCYR
jgi:hypothetical protein